MTMEDRLAAFFCLKEVLTDFLERGQGYNNALLDSAVLQAQAENQWFTEESIRQALKGVCELLKKEALEDWIARYNFDGEPKKVACVLAGNIPMVGFHDMLCVLLSGHHFVGKLSSKDSKLLPTLAKVLENSQPDFGKSITFSESLQGVNYDAVIATGSNNSARYFEHYFGGKPHIIRKGRSSVAILSGEETVEELEGLADDIFMYFGLGCRNVSKIYIPKGFDVRKIFPYFEKYKAYANHHKWMNNYDYNRSINLVNQASFYETGFALFQEHTALVSPIAMVYYEQYESASELCARLAANDDELQCVVANLEQGKFVPFGKVQFPKSDDYADGIDTLAFLEKI